MLGGRIVFETRGRAVVQARVRAGDSGRPAQGRGVILALRHNHHPLCDRGGEGVQGGPNDGTSRHLQPGVVLVWVRVGVRVSVRVMVRVRIRHVRFLRTEVSGN